MFSDREEAGLRLAEKLIRYNNDKNTVVVAIPRGGVPIGSIIAKTLNLPLEIVLSKKIEDVIENFEPRARLVGVRSIPNYDKNSYDVSVEFYVVNTPTELVDLTIFLERLR